MTQEQKPEEVKEDKEAIRRQLEEEPQEGLSQALREEAKTDENNSEE